jgi:diadenosine tetraphosphate (Ap4A) HIT family hydrolase
MVPQLHMHIVARWRDDPAWPGPVWGFGARRPYEPAARAERAATLGEALRSATRR